MRIHQHKKPVCIVVLALLCLLAAAACRSHHFRSNYKNANRLLHETFYKENTPYLKAHMKNGDVCIFEDQWEVKSPLDVVEGHGTRYNFNRQKIYQGRISCPVDSVAIFETNQNPEEMEKDRIRALSLMAVLDAGVGLFCLINPKACFGSCPTFYIDDDRSVHSSDAEGFSNAILPSLEYADVDALNIQCRRGDTFSLIMKNEALETHCIKDLRLLACPVSDDRRVFQSPYDEFYLCDGYIPVSRAMGSEGEVTSQLRFPDKQERISLADKDDMSSKEEVVLEFRDVEDSRDLGLLTGFRQTLMTTYLIYSAMGYMGDHVADVFATIERNQGGGNGLFSGLKRALGGIDVYLWNEQENMWELQGGLYETGPIAINHQILPLDSESGISDVRLKIVLNQGLWRIDYFALTNMVKKSEPIILEPDSVLIQGEADSLKLEQIHAENRYLISLPGNRYQFFFSVPGANSNYELFLHSEGYYLEWMREGWIKNKNLFKLRQMLKNPEKYLKKEAEAYKNYEKTMEEVFWNTRIDAQNSPSHEK